MSSPEDPFVDAGQFQAPGERNRAAATDRFPPPGRSVLNPFQWFLPAVQITFVSALAGTTCFVYASVVSPARMVFTQPLPPVWAVLLGFVVAAWIALAVRRRPGSWVARIWPVLLLALSGGLLVYALYETRSNAWPLLSSLPWRGAWIHPVWQALVVALLTALLPLLLRLRRVRVNSPWIRRMGAAAVFLVLPLFFPIKQIEEWSIHEGARAMEGEVERLAAAREAIEEAARKPGKPGAPSKLSPIQTGGLINDRSIWFAAAAVRQTKRLQHARDAVALALAGVRDRAKCPRPPDAVPQPTRPRPPGPYARYDADDTITDYLQKVEDQAASFENDRKNAEKQRGEVARLCRGLRPPKGLESEPLACELSEEEAACPPAPAPPASSGGARAAIRFQDIVPGTALFPSLAPAFFQTLLGRNKKSLLAAGCYPVADYYFSLVLYCNIYGPRETDADKKDARVRLQTWVSFEGPKGSPVSDGSQPNQLFVTIATVGGPGKPIHGGLFDDFKSNALPEKPDYDDLLCPERFCFFIASGTQRIRVARRKSEERNDKRGTLRLNAWIPPGSR